VSAQSDAFEFDGMRTGRLSRHDPPAPSGIVPTGPGMKGCFNRPTPDAGRTSANRSIELELPLAGIRKFTLPT